MSDPFPSPGQVYAELPYQFDQFEDIPPIRFPVAGPAPFNTMVVVRTRVFISDYGPSTGDLDRDKGRVQTNLTVRGNHDNWAQGVQHSSTGVIRMLNVSDEQDFPTEDGGTTFTWAIDVVHAEGRLDEQGRFELTVETAEQAYQVWAAVYAEISSWVLCNEPR